jgi:O-antigen ligase
MTNTLNSPRRIDRITWVIVLAFGYMCCWTILNFLRGTNLYDGRVTGPVGGFFANPNDLALNMASFLPLALMHARRPNAAITRLLGAGIALLMLVVMFLTKSRGGTLGTLAMLITFLLTARVLTPATIIALVVTTMATMPLLPPSFWNRMASITDPRKDDTGSRAERKILLQQGWTVFVDHPLTGVGMGQFRNFYRPGLATRWHETHNVLLQVAAEIGVFGLAVFTFLVVRGFAAAWWTRRRLMWIYRKRSRMRHGKADADEPRDDLTDDERHYLQTHGTAMLACMVGWFVCALFASVAFNWTFYYVLALAVAGRDVVRTRERAFRKARARAPRAAPAA